MTAWTSSLVSVVLVSLVSLVGLVTISMGEARVRQFATVLVSFAVGALLGDAFIHLIPEAFARQAGQSTSLLILAGILLFFVVEKLLRHSHGPLHQHVHPDGDGLPPLAVINLVGDAVHNLIDGVLIAASYLTSPALGVATTLAVLLHEVPHELGNFGVLVHSGLTVRKAALYNLATAITAVVGTVLTLLAGSAVGGSVTTALLPVAAGGFVYIAAANLIPELHHERSLPGVVLQGIFIGLGIAIMAALRAYG